MFDRCCNSESRTKSAWWIGEHAFVQADTELSDAPQREDLEISAFQRIIEHKSEHRLSKARDNMDCFLRTRRTEKSKNVLLKTIYYTLAADFKTVVATCQKRVCRSDFDRAKASGTKGALRDAKLRSRSTASYRQE